MKFREIFWETLGYGILYKQRLAQALLLPFMLYIALDMVPDLEMGLLVSTGMGVLTVIVHTVFAITTHRIILLGPDAVPKWGITKWSKRETFFSLHFVGLTLIFVPLSFLGFIPVVGWVLATGLFSWLLGRFSLVFPGIAVDEGVTFKLSWELTKNRQKLMVLVVVVFPVFLMFPAFLLKLLPYTLPITSFLSTLATVFTVIALSASYKHIGREFFTG